MWYSVPGTDAGCVVPGNLRSAVRVGERKYRLLLRDDVSTVTVGPPVKPGARWFYFRYVLFPAPMLVQHRCSGWSCTENGGLVRGPRVTGAVKGVRYTLSLENMIKSDSLFKEGMKPLVWSRGEHEKSGRAWQRGCDNVQYAPNEDKYQKAGCAYNFHTLSFDLTPLHDDDEIFLGTVLGRVRFWAGRRAERAHVRAIACMRSAACTKAHAIDIACMHSMFCTKARATEIACVRRILCTKSHAKVHLHSTACTHML
eukprot:2502297-Rhodomonas_salina.1